jgi:hypothetical protein
MHEEDTALLWPGTMYCVTLYELSVALLLVGEILIWTDWSWQYVEEVGMSKYEVALLSTTAALRC